MTNVRNDAQAQPLDKEEQRRNSYALGSASAKNGRGVGAHEVPKQ